MSTKRKVPKLLIAFIAATAVLLSGATLTGATRRAARADNTTVTIKLNGGGVSDGEGGYITDEITKGAVIETARLTHDYVRNLFSWREPLMMDGSAPAVRPTDNGVFTTPLLRAFFEDLNGNVVPDEGEPFYLSGDYIEIKAGLELTCYYDNNGFVYSDISWQSAPYIALEKGWDREVYPDLDATGKEMHFKARDMQPLYHEIHKVNQYTFSDCHYDSVNDQMHDADNNNIKSVELPTTVRQLGNGVFKRDWGLTAVTGTDNVYGYDWQTFSGVKVGKLVFSKFEYFGRYGLNLDNVQMKFVIEGYGKIPEERNLWSSLNNGTDPLIDNETSATGNYPLTVYVPEGETENFMDTGDKGDWVLQYKNGGYIPVRNMYTVKFDPNGANVYIQNQHQDAGAEEYVHTDNSNNVHEYNPAAADLTRMYVSKPADPQKTGKYFMGWQDAEGYVWQDSDFGVTGKVLEGDITLTAEWADAAMVSFDSQGGSAVESLNILKGSKITAPVSPIRKAYAFAGWYTGADVAWDFAGDTVDSSEMTLYAKWTPSALTATYSYADRDEHDNPASFTVETPTITLTGAVRAGYTFDGWYSAATGGTQVTEIPLGTDENVRVYARWTAAALNITYNNATGATHGNPGTFTTEESVTLTDAAKDGYTFNGWYDAATGGTKITVIPAGTTEGVTLYARWAAVTYNITYGNMEGAEHSNPEDYTIESAAITLAEPAKSGYTFGGWYKNAEFTGDAVTVIPAGSTGNIALFAKWTENTSGNGGGCKNSSAAGFGSAAVFGPAAAIFLKKRKGV